VRPLVGTRVTPNHLTTLRLATGLVAAACYATTDTAWHFTGSAAFLFSMLLDRADGELARLSGKFSRHGHQYDLIVDALSNGLAFFAIGFGVRNGALGNLSIALGTLAFVSVLVVLGVVLRGESKLGSGTIALPPMGRFDPDDAMIAVPIAMVFGAGVPLIVAAAIGTPIMAAVFLIRFRKHLF